MGHSSRSYSLTPETFSILRDLVEERLGLYFDNGKSDFLVDRLSPLVTARGLTSFMDYYYLLKYDRAKAAEEWKRVADALTVNETYFWREADQVLALTQKVVPELLALLPRAVKLRVWSAACATGEEPLTIAMALNEAGLLDDDRIEIDASDVSEEVLQKARLGLYRERSLRSLPAELKTKYFREESGLWRVDPALHARVRWHQVNLVDQAEVERFACSSVIFCRNLFIYFSRATMLEVVDTFYRCMPRPGYLFLGAAESLLRLGTAFEFEAVGNAFVYVKR